MENQNTTDCVAGAVLQSLFSINWLREDFIFFLNIVQEGNGGALLTYLWNIVTPKLLKLQEILNFTRLKYS